MFNIDINRATPSYGEIEISIPLDAIESYWKMNTGYNVEYGSDVDNMESEILILDKSNNILAGDYFFSLEHSIMIYENNNGYTAKYIQTEKKTTELETLSTPFLKTEIRNQNFIMKARAYQYKINKYSREISSSSFLNKKIHSFEFSDQFIGARAFYKLNGETEEIELRYSNLGNKKTTDTKFAYYTLKDKTELEIAFSSILGEFSPQPNSSLEVNIYTTKGTEVPNKFSGDAVMSLSDEDLRSLPIVVNFNPQYIIGGSDIPSLKEIKQLVVNEISTRDVIVTESDLNNYFEILTKLIENINNGNIKFIKKRDDILKRVFSAYILLRDGLDTDGNSVETADYVSNCIPTNTIDADFQISRNMSKPFGTVIKLKEGESNKFECIESVLSSDENDFYIIPFYTRISLDPIKKVKYIYNLTDCETTLEYKAITKSSSTSYITPNSVSLKRTLTTIGTNADSWYTFNFNFTTNISDKNVFLKSEVFSLKIYNSENSSALLGSVVFSNIEKDAIIFTKNEDEETYNVSLSLKVYVDTEEFDFSEENSEINYGTFINLKNENNLVFTAPEDIKITLEIKDLEVNSGNTITESFQTKGSLSLFKNLDNLMFSNINLNTTEEYFLEETTEDTSESSYYSEADILSLIINEVEGDISNIFIDDVAFTSVTSETDISEKSVIRFSQLIDNVTTIRIFNRTSILSYIEIKDIPVVHSSFFKNEISKTDFVSQLFTYINILKENLKKLETNTFFDLKFFNTYGPSQLYDTLKTNLNFETTVYLKEEVDKETLSPLIKDYIRRLIDNSNNNNSLKVSQINSEVLKAYEAYIDHIDFEGLNGTFKQSIKKLDNDNEYLYTPE